MSKQRTPAKPDTLTPDVVIVGAGIQGLMLLKAFVDYNDSWQAKLSKSNFSVVLLEQDKLGAEQTSHAQAYLHHGYLYNSGRFWTQREDWFGRAAAIWECELATTRRVTTFSRVAYSNLDMGFKESVRKVFARVPETIKKRCPMQPDLPRQRTPRWNYDPKKSEFATFFRTGERVLDVGRFIDAIQADSRYEEQISQVTEVSVSAIGTKLRDPRVRCKIGERNVEFRPRFVVLAAGAGNSAIINDFLRSQGQAAVKVAFQKLAHLLVLRSRNLPIINLLGPEANGAFLVTKSKSDDQSERAWIFTNNDSWYTPQDDTDGHKIPLADWVQDAVRQVERITGINLNGLNSAGQLRARAGTVKLSRGVTPSTLGTTQIDGGRCWMPEGSLARSLRAIWPDRLTFSVLAANDQVDFFREQFSSHRSSRFDVGLWSGLRQPVQPAPPYWDKSVGFSDWAEFAKRHHIG